jgi:hypothetical protein
MGEAFRRQNPERAVATIGFKLSAPAYTKVLRQPDFPAIAGPATGWILFGLSPPTVPVLDFRVSVYGNAYHRSGSSPRLGTFMPIRLLACCHSIKVPSALPCDLDNSYSTGRPGSRRKPGSSSAAVALESPIVSLIDLPWRREGPALRCAA